MPDLSKIKLDGTTYNLKDSIARTLVIPVTTNESGEMQPVGTTLIEAIEAFNAGRRIVLRNNNYDLYIDHANNTSLEGTSNNPDGNGYFHITWDSNGLTGDSVGMPPKTTSDLINDSDFVTTSEVNSLITSAVGNINSFEVSVVASLPTSDINTHIIYFVSNSSSGDSIYDEYMYINNNWEKIGSTAVDLSNYLQKTDISDWAKANTKPSYTASEVGAIADTEPVASITQTNIDNWTKKSNLFTISSGSTDNDYWWKLKIDRSNLFAFTNAPGSNGYLKYIELPVNRGNDYISLQLPTTSGKLALVSDISSTVPAWARASTKPTYTASEVGALPDTTIIPTVPTDISAFNNDAGYLTSFTETDPTVPAWAKAASKPTYTAAEVGAVPLTSSGNITITNTGKSTSTIQFINDDDNPGLIKILAEEVRINGIPTPTSNNQAVNKKYVDDSIATITHPTNISAFNNDVGYLTSFTETDPTVPAWAKAATKPTYTAGEVGAAASNHTHTEIGTYGSSGDGYITTSINSVKIEASANGGGTQNILTLTGTTTTIHKVVTPTADGDAANKKYVDDAIAAITHPTNVSTFTNDVGYLTLADLPIYDGTVV